MANLPAVVWLGYGVHGNEISSPDAALLTAYHLLAARNDKHGGQILAKRLLLIDPTQNPDGRERFLQQLRRGSAAGAGRAVRLRPSTTSRGPAAAPTITCSI